MRGIACTWSIDTPTYAWTCNARKEIACTTMELLVAMNREALCAATQVVAVRRGGNVGGRFVDSG